MNLTVATHIINQHCPWIVVADRAFTRVVFANAAYGAAVGDVCALPRFSPAMPSINGAPWQAQLSLSAGKLPSQAVQVSCSVVDEMVVLALSPLSSPKSLSSPPTTSGFKSLFRRKQQQQQQQQQQPPLAGVLPFFERMDDFGRFVKAVSSVDSETLNRQDAQGYTLLHVAMQQQDDRFALFLLQLASKARVDLANDSGNTAVHLFCAHWSSPTSLSQAFELLVRAGADFSLPNRALETPLHKAVFNSSCRLLIVDLLVTRAGCSTNVQNASGDTPLMYAVRLRRVDLVAMLLKNAAGTDVSIQNKQGKTVLDLVVADDELRDLFKDVVATVTTTARPVARPSLPTKMPTHLSHHSLKLPHPRDDDITLSRAELSEFGGDADDERLWLQFGDLEFVDRIGEGATATVFRANWHGQQCAVKVLRTAASETDVSDFKREFAMLAVLQHNRFVRFIGATLSPQVSLVMEFCEGGSLATALHSHELDIAWTTGVRWMHDVLDGVSTLHALEPAIVHRDIKPGNILLTGSGDVKIADFGLSRRTAGEAATLRKIRGTMAFLAPEIFAGGEFSPASDVYACGILMWEIATRCADGQLPAHPFASFANLRKDFQILMHVSKKNLRPPIGSTMPPELSSIVTRCWSASAAERPGADAVARELRDLFQRHVPAQWTRVAGSKTEIFTPFTNNTDDDDDE
jgi:hypothetical protein